MYLCVFFRKNLGIRKNRSNFARIWHFEATFEYLEKQLT